MPNDVDRPLTPGELLAAAADRIRDLAAAAQAGPWIYNDADDRVMVGDTPYRSPATQERTTTTLSGSLPCPPR